MSLQEQYAILRLVAAGLAAYLAGELVILLSCWL